MKETTNKNKTKTKKSSSYVKKKEITLLSDEELLEQILKKNKETGKMEAYCYKLDGEFLMLQEITVQNMKYSKMEINGNNMDFYFTKHMGTTINLDNKNVNACNANELSNNNIADDYVVEQVLEINYMDEDAAFHIEMPQHLAKTVADLKKSC